MRCLILMLILLCNMFIQANGDLRQEVCRLTRSGNSDLIADRAFGAIGATSTLYGVALQTEHLDYGNLACATVVSAILKQAGFLQRIEASCPGLKGALETLGWQNIDINDSSAFQPGDV
ncbi:MAG: hypothetical protein PHQ23_01270, partial [Candidatus Wallbacteria bacterium]|nr:hypothetical protein [Candidatus Wallbacteria bacterium]